MTTLDITVRGSAEQHHPAERAIVSMVLSIDGPDRPQVFADAVAIQDPLAAQLKELVELRAVQTWHSDQVRVFTHRPWERDGQRGATVHVARVELRAEFSDFERLSAFIDQWSGADGVEVSGIEWDVSGKSRRVHEAEVRRSAVDDAIAKAQAYADAVRRGKVVALEIADPGMLSGSGDAPVTLHRAASTGNEPGLALVPGEIVIRVEVDARFRAD